MNIWLVEDDEDIRDMVAYTLKASGYAVQSFDAAPAFFHALRPESLPGLLLLDIMLPGQDGLSILKTLRERADTRSLPVILLTAKGQEYDKVLGLDAGADDYVAKPFGMMELLARVKALLRRSGGQPGGPADTELHSGALVLNRQKRTAAVDGVPLSLTLKEFDLLQYLLQNPGVVHTRDILLDRIWGYRYEGGTRTVDVHVRALRQKLGSEAAQIETVRGVGYKLSDKQ